MNAGERRSLAAHRRTRRGRRRSALLTRTEHAPHRARTALERRARQVRWRVRADPSALEHVADARVLGNREVVRLQVLGIDETLDREHAKPGDADIMAPDVVNETVRLLDGSGGEWAENRKPKTKRAAEATLYVVEIRGIEPC